MPFCLCSSDQIGRAHVELQSHSHLVCRLLLEKKTERIASTVQLLVRDGGDIEHAPEVARRLCVLSAVGGRSPLVHAPDTPPSVFFFLKDGAAGELSPLSPPAPSPS